MDQSGLFERANTLLTLRACACHERGGKVCGAGRFEIRRIVENGEQNRITGV